MLGVNTREGSDCNCSSLRPSLGAVTRPLNNVSGLPLLSGEAQKTDHSSCISERAAQSNSQEPGGLVLGVPLVLAALGGAWLRGVDRPLSSWESRRTKRSRLRGSGGTGGPGDRGFRISIRTQPHNTPGQYPMSRESKKEEVPPSLLRLYPLL